MVARHRFVTVGAIVEPPAGGSGLVVTPGDHENLLAWSPLSGGAPYTVERFDPSRSTAGTWTTIYTGSSLAYTDSPAYYSGTRAQATESAYTTGKGLIPGLPYQYRVTSNTGTIAGPEVGRPNITGLNFPPAWTTSRGSSSVRDARNTGHWDAISGSPTITGTGNQTLSPGTYNDTIFRGQCRLVTGTYVFNRCWLMRSLFNDSGETPSTVPTLTFVDCTIGPETWIGSNSSVYDINGLGAAGGKVTLQRTMMLHGGSQLFTHIAGPNLIEDSFFMFLFCPDYLFEVPPEDRPHADCIWDQNGGTTTTVRRNYFESSASGQSSHILSGSSNSGITIQDNLFNGLPASGSLEVSAGATYTGNRWLRTGVGGMGGGGLPMKAIGSPASSSDNRWADDNAAV